MMRTIFAAGAALSLLLAPAVVAFASEDAPTVDDLAQARRCAAETRVAGHAFREVRDSVRAGGTTRAESLLSVAEDALLDARSACRDNTEISAQLELLAGEAEALRRVLR
ncbi:MAG: hypothetical protein ABR587_08515 [Candidatus Binatia bacterium]